MPNVDTYIFIHTYIVTFTNMHTVHKYEYPHPPMYRWRLQS